MSHHSPRNAPPRRPLMPNPRSLGVADADGEGCPGGAVSGRGDAPLIPQASSECSARPPVGSLARGPWDAHPSAPPVGGREPAGRAGLGRPPRPWRSKTVCARWGAYRFAVACRPQQCFSMRAWSFSVKRSDSQAVSVSCRGR